MKKFDVVALGELLIESRQSAVFSRSIPLKPQVQEIPSAEVR